MDSLETFTNDWLIFGNHILTWIWAAAIFVAVYILAPKGRKRIVKYLDILDPKHTSIVSRVALQVLNTTQNFFIAAVSLLIAKQFLVLPIPAERFAKAAILVMTMVQIALWSRSLINIWVEAWLLDKKRPDPERSSAAQVIKFIALTVAWSAILLLTLSNFGIDITGLVAGLGVGGIAIAFALQSILKDLFASLSIILDKPFVVGDLINFDTHWGYVEQVGLRTTRIRSLSGEQMSVSNDALLATRLKNFRRMTERRVNFSLHTFHGAEISILGSFPTYVKEMIEGLGMTRFDRAHLAEFNDVGARFEIVYFVLSPEMIDYMNLHQTVLLNCGQWFHDHGLEFAVPSRRILREEI